MFLLAGLFLLALLPRLVYLLELQRSPLEGFLSLDTETHDMLARRIAAEGSTGEAVFFRAPLYPYLLGYLYALFGEGRLAPRILQALLGALAAPLTYLLGLRLAGRRPALFAALAISFYWTLVYFGGELLLDGLLVPLDLLVLLFLAWRGAERLPGPWQSLAAGLALGISALTRPNILLFLPLALGWLAWLAARGGTAARSPAGDPRGSRFAGGPEPRPPSAAAARGGGARPSGDGGGGAGIRSALLSRAFLAPALAFLLGAALVVAPVTARNWVKGRDLVLIAWQGGINFYMGNGPDANGRAAVAPADWADIPQAVRQRFRDQVWAKEIVWIAAIHLAEQETGRTGLAPSEVSRFWSRKGREHILAHPLAFLSLLGRKGYFLVNAYEIPSNKDLEYFMREGRLYTLRVLALFLPGTFPFGLVCPLAILGIGFALPDWRRHLLAWLFLGSYALTVLLFFVVARFRIPLLPLLLLYAGLAAVELARRWRERRLPGGSGRLARPLLFLLLLVALCNSRFFGVRDDILLATLHYNLANHFIDEGATDRAEAEYLEALRLNPDFPGADYNLGNIHFDRREYERADAHYRRALELDPQMAMALTNLGLIAFARGDDTTAERLFRHSLALEPGSAEAHYNLGKALARQGRDAEAAAENARALELNPQMWQAAFNQGNSLYGEGKLEEARQAYARAVACKPDHAAARCNLGIVLLRLGRVEEARAALAEAVRLDPELARAHYRLAEIHAQQGDAEAAARELREVLRREPGNESAARLLRRLEAGGQSQLR